MDHKNRFFCSFKCETRGEGHISHLKPQKNLFICVAHMHPGHLSPNHLAKFKWPRICRSEIDLEFCFCFMSGHCDAGRVPVSATLVMSPGTACVSRLTWRTEPGEPCFHLGRNRDPVAAVWGVISMVTVRTVTTWMMRWNTGENWSTSGA